MQPGEGENGPCKVNQFWEPHTLLHPVNGSIAR
jgi:hypothetical protein